MALVSSFVVPSVLGTLYIPLGEGPDEIAHIDYTFFTFAKPNQPLLLAKGILEPGVAPVGQGHQPPLSYWLGARILGTTLSPDEVGPFVDYQAGLAYSSEGALFGGKDQCSYRIDSNRVDSETLRFRYAMYALRIFNALLLSASVLLTYLTGRLFFGSTHVLPPCLALLHASIPTALYRSVFVSNDNLVALLCSLVFYLSCAIITKHLSANSVTAIGLGAIAGLAFLSKYSGVVGLGIAGLGFLLRPGLGIARRAISLLLLLIGFVVVVAPDLVENYSLDGDLLSTPLIIRVVPFLYSPNSFRNVLTNIDFSTTVLERFWINFHAFSPTIGDRDFPLWTFTVYWILFGCGTIGSVSAVLFSTKRDQYIRAFAVASMTLAGSILAIIYFATSFPLPGGRYLHVAITAFAVYVPLGIYTFLELIAGEKHANRSTVVLFSALWIAAQAMTAGYLGQRFEGCAEKAGGNVPAGIAVASGDITGDGVDELFLYHRIKNTVYVAQRDVTSNRFSFVPTWTRTVGLVADSLFVEDLNGDSIDDLVFWRPFASLWVYVDGRSIADHDTNSSPYPERSARFNYLPTKRTMPTVAFVGDVDGDSLADLVTYHQSLGTTLIERPAEQQTTLRRDPGRLIKLETNAGETPLLLPAPIGAVGLVSTTTSATLTSLSGTRTSLSGEFSNLVGAAIEVEVLNESEADLISTQNRESCVWKLHVTQLIQIACLETDRKQALFADSVDGDAKLMVISSVNGQIQEIHNSGDVMHAITVFAGF